MANNRVDRIYLLEAHQRGAGGRWGPWYLMDRFAMVSQRVARRERDRLNEGNDEWECRIVPFNRDRGKV